MPRTLRPFHFATLAALEATLEIAMRALLESYPELRGEPRPGNSAEAVTAASLVDQCGRVLAALAAHRRQLPRAPRP